jgi:hypothetical protein
MEHRQRICVSQPKSQPEDLERHLVHSENHGSSVLDPRISLKDIDEGYEWHLIEGNAARIVEPGAQPAQQPCQDGTRKQGENTTVIPGFSPVYSGVGDDPVV